MDDEAETHPTIKPNPPIEKRKSPNFRVVYSNEFRYRVSPNDIGLIFANLADTGDAERTMVSTDEVLVQMAIGQAKALAEYLTMIVSRFERTIGPVRAIGKAPPSEGELDSMFRILENIGLH